MERNESLLMAAMYFWSNTLNAFAFAQGPMTLKQDDVIMLTDLNINHPVTPFWLLDPVTHKLPTRDVGGWAKYVTAYSITGSVDDREHCTFLNMWLEKFIFCGSTLGPTSNHLSLAKQLVIGKGIPLGKYLLGAIYSLMNHVSIKLSTQEPIGSIGGPWCFVQLWLNLYTYQAMGHDLNKSLFPSSDYSEEAKPKHHYCMSFGEAVSNFRVDKADTP